jgi:hypothetical protein
MHPHFVSPDQTHSLSASALTMATSHIGASAGFFGPAARSIGDPQGISGSKEAEAKVDAIGSDHQGHQQADAAKDGDDFQALDIVVDVESPRESPCESGHLRSSNPGHERAG